jgi:hypothetical protein
MPAAPVSTPPPPIVEHYALLLEEQFPGYVSGTKPNTTLAELYINYMRKHPNADAQQVYKTVVGRLQEVANLPGTIGGAIGSTATIIGDAGPAAGVGVNKAAKGIGIPGQGDWTNLVTRLAEFAIGIILLNIGLRAIIGKTQGYQKVETIVTGTAGRMVPGVGSR